MVTIRSNSFGVQMAISGKNLPKSSSAPEWLVTLILMLVFAFGWFYFNRPYLIFERIMKDTDIDVVRFLYDALAHGDVHL
jgi:hypothetical protein